MEMGVDCPQFAKLEPKMSSFMQALVFRREQMDVLPLNFV